MSERLGLRAVSAVLAALTIGSLSACGPVGDASSADSAPGKYEQTWQTGYGETSCADWPMEMDAHQRFVAAADMLVGGRKVWGIDTMPADSLITSFEDDISRTCQVSPSDNIGDVATSLLLIGGLAEYGH